MSETKKSVFETLNAVNVNEHIEKKNGLSYLSWAWAWGILKVYYPDATYKIYEDDSGFFYHTDGRTAWVKVGVTVEGIENVEYLPVMDYRNQSIPIEKMTSMDANKAIQRALTKAVARHGLGLYIYAGEDLPEAERNAKKSTNTSKTSAKAYTPKGGKKAEDSKSDEDAVKKVYRSQAVALCKKLGHDPKTYLPEQYGVDKNTTVERWKEITADLRKQVKELDKKESGSEENK